MGTSLCDWISFEAFKSICNFCANRFSCWEWRSLSCSPLNVTHCIWRFQIVPAPIISSLSEDCSDCGLETKDSSQFGNEMFTFSIESIHNLNAGDWLLELQYSRFCIEVHLMYGQKSYANSISPTRRLAGLHIHSPLVFDPSQLYHFNHKSIGSNFVNSQYIHFAFWVNFNFKIKIKKVFDQV